MLLSPAKSFGLLTMESFRVLEYSKVLGAEEGWGDYMELGWLLRSLENAREKMGCDPLLLKGFNMRLGARDRMVLGHLPVVTVVQWGMMSSPQEEPWCVSCELESTSRLPLRLRDTYWTQDGIHCIAIFRTFVCKTTLYRCVSTINKIHALERWETENRYCYPSLSLPSSSSFMPARSSNFINIVSLIPSSITAFHSRSTSSMIPSLKARSCESAKLSAFLPVPLNALHDDPTL